MFFMRSWKIGFLAMCKVVGLSQNMGTGLETFKPRGPKSLVSQVTSAVTLRRALYSASDEEREIVGYFLLFQEIGLPQRVM